LKLSKNIRGELVSIAAASPYNKCFCIDCGEELIKKNKNPENRKREIHFAHYSDCPGSLETYLHKMAKLVIEKEKRIVLPRLGEIETAVVLVEKPLHQFVPDIFLTDINGKEIVIEIFVTHKTGEEKIDKIKLTQLDAFEIDLSSLDYDADIAAIQFNVIENLSNKKDLNPPEEKNDGKKSSRGIWVLLTAVGALVFFRWLKKRKRKSSGRRFIS
jgi:hypothetical protein